MDLVESYHFRTYKYIRHQATHQTELLVIMLNGLLFTSLDSFDGYDTVDQYQPRFYNMKINTVIKDSYFRKLFSSMCGPVPCPNGFWCRQFGAIIKQNAWSLPILVTKEARLCISQSNILHNIQPIYTTLQDKIDR